MTSPAPTESDEAAVLRCLLGAEQPGVLVLRSAELLLGARRRSGATLSTFDRVVVILPIRGVSAVTRLVSWSWTVARLFIVGAALRSAGFTLEGRFGVFPTIQNPTIVYQFDSPAAHYAAQYLLLEPVRGFAAGIRTKLGRASGCATSLGGVVVVGKRQ